MCGIAVVILTEHLKRLRSRSVRQHLFIEPHLLYRAVGEAKPNCTVSIALAIGQVHAGICPKLTLGLIRFTEDLLDDGLSFSGVNTINGFLVDPHRPSQSFAGRQSHRGFGSGYTTGMLWVLAEHWPRTISEAFGIGLDGIELFVN